MDIIESERRSVIDDNNSAQEELTGILTRLNPNTKQLVFSKPFHGDLDFSVLIRMGFRNVESISFDKGEITSIINLPQSLRVLQCSDQLLNGLFDLPIYLEELICDYNYLTSLSCKTTKSLKILKISHNRLEQLDELPNSLEELYCTNNRLQLLNLEGLDDLKVLHVSENPALIIEHLSSEIVDFKSDNSPFANVQYDNEGEQSSKLPASTSNINDLNHIHTVSKIDYIDALHTYFKLKKTYEYGILKKKREVFNSAPTRAIGKKMVSEIKPKCINCGRPVGTIFDHKNDKYIAICGERDLTRKCSLNIQLFRGHFSDEESMLYIFKSEFDKSKETIVRQKLDTLFNYISERDASDRFKKELENYNIESNIYHGILDSFNEKYFSKTRQEKINEKMTKINDLLSKNDSIMSDYKMNSENRELLRDAIRLQIREIIPEMENLRRLKYELTEMDVDVNISGANVYDILSTLVQRQITVSNIDYTLEEPPRVVKFSKKD